MSRPAVLVISSHVVRGAVGARAAFALERLGHRSWTLPTVLLPWHPGHGPAHRIVAPAADFAAMTADLARAPWLGEIGGVVTGYLGHAEQAGPIAALIDAVRRANPDALVLVDPVSGDEAGPYVPPDVLAAQRERLLPLADVATPNRFELGLLTGEPVTSLTEIVAAARRLGPATTVVTSVPAMMRGKIGSALVRETEVFVAEHTRIDGAPSGTGDLFAAVLLSQLMTATEPSAALAAAAATVFELVARSARAGADELLLAAEQGSIVRPTAPVDLRRWMAPPRPRSGDERR